MSLRIKRLWQKSLPKATPTRPLRKPGAFWRRLSCQQPRGASESRGWHSSLPQRRRVPCLRVAVGLTPSGPQVGSLFATRRGALSRPRPPRLICIGTRAAPASGRAGAAGEAARARPDSWALLAPPLVPGFRAQHGGQGDSNSLLLPLLHKRHSGDPACSPSPLPISFFAWFLDSVSWGSSPRVVELCGAWTGGRGCLVGGGEGGGIVC